MDLVPPKHFVCLEKFKNNKMNIVFRVNSSNKEGYGHFSRSLLLAKYFKKKNYNIYFISNNLNKYSIKLLNKNNFHYFVEKKEYSKNYQINDIKFTIKTLKKINKIIDFVIVDCYLLGLKWEKKIKNYTKKLVVIDDIDRKHYCDIYIAPFNKPNKKNIINQKCKILAGLKYIIIKKIKFKKNTNNNIKNILIYMGDADKKNLTLKILKVIKKKFYNVFNFKILIGNSNLKRVEIFKNAKNIKNISFLNYQSSFSKIVNKIDTAIVSGGSTIFELTAGGVPTLSICQNIKQYQLLKRNRICNPNNILKYNNFSNKNLEKFLKKRLLKKKININKINFDFLGPKRILQYI